MNIADIGVILLLGGSMYFGWKKGFIVAVIEFFKWIASIIIAKLFYVRFTDFMISIFGDPRPKLLKHVKNYLYDMLNISQTSAQPMAPTEMSTAITSLKIPVGFENKIKEGIEQKLIKTTSGFVEEASTHMTEMLMYGMGFLLLVVILISMLSFVQVVSKYLSKLPVIKEFNNGGGLLLGAAIGVVSVYFVLAMLSYMRAFGWASDILKSVESSQFAIYFHKYNIIQYLLNHVLLKG